MWRGLAATTGELVVFLDTDTEDFDRAFVLGLLGPLLTDAASPSSRATSGARSSAATPRSPTAAAASPSCSRAPT